MDELYPNRRYGELSLRHASAATHVGKEYVLIADALDLPIDSFVSGRKINWIRSQSTDSNASGELAGLASA